MNRAGKALFIAMTVLLGLQSVSAVTTVSWDKQAIPIRLVVGVEQLVHLDGPATVGLPPALASRDVFRHLFATDTAYWKAMRPFDTQRIKVRMDETGQMVLFDVSAVTERKPPKSVEPLRVLVSASHAQEKSGPARPPAPRQAGATMFDLIRYAVQQDYAPARVITPLRGVREVTNKLAGSISALYAHRDAVSLRMTVTRGWATERFHVNSVLVENLTAYEITVDPSRMQHMTGRRSNGVSNQFLATAMLIRVLGPQGAVTRPDQTRLYIVTDRPLTSLVARSGDRR